MGKLGASLLGLAAVCVALVILLTATPVGAVSGLGSARAAATTGSISVTWKNVALSGLCGSVAGTCHQCDWGGQISNTYTGRQVTPQCHEVLTGKGAKQSWHLVYSSDAVAMNQTTGTIYPGQSEVIWFAYHDNGVCSVYQSDFVKVVGPHNTVVIGLECD
jgi:hypothetical protein